VIVDFKFSRRPFDRSAGGNQPFDARAFQVIATLAAPGS
jgi:hypothetical protein